MSLKVVIGGGSGFIGQNLVKALKKRGHSVIIVSRRSGQPDTVTWQCIEKDGLPPDTDAVVNLAGKNISSPLGRFISSFKEEVQDSRLKTTGLLRNAIVSSAVKPRVWISISGVGAYEPSLTQKYDEDSPCTAKGFLGELTKDWEEASRLTAECEKTRHVIVRSGSVLGRNGGALKSLMTPFWLGLGGPISTGEQFFPWIHQDDMSGILIHAIENDGVVGILNGVAPSSATNEEFSSLFAKALRRPCLLRTPAFAMKLMLGEDISTVVLEGQNVIPKRTLESGYQYIHPDLEEALKDVVESS